ncbi:unnamed protein product, partial [Ectocarpus sp. 13 AM-2016]
VKTQTRHCLTRCTMSNIINHSRGPRGSPSALMYSPLHKRPSYSYTVEDWQWQDLLPALMYGAPPSKSHDPRRRVSWASSLLWWHEGRALMIPRIFPSIWPTLLATRRKLLSAPTSGFPVCLREAVTASNIMFFHGLDISINDNIFLSTD